MPLFTFGGLVLGLGLVISCHFLPFTACFRNRLRTYSDADTRNVQYPRSARAVLRSFYLLTYLLTYLHMPNGDSAITFGCGY